MRSRRPRAAPPLIAALACAAALVLAGCSGGSAEPASLADVAVTAAGAQQPPAVEVPQGFSVDATATRVLNPGQGEVVRAGDVIGVQYVLVNGTTGERVASSAWDEPPTSLVVDDSILPGLRTALVDQRIGSDVLVAVAPADGPAAGGGASPQPKVGPRDTLVFVVKLISAVPPRAEGAPVPPPPGLPTVTLDEETGEPTITVPQAEPPPDLVVQELIAGSGEEVAEGQTVRVQYEGVRWSDGAEFDSSWTAGSPAPFVVGEGTLIQGWDVGLVGQRVGSQVLLIVPPKDGYGEQGNASAGIDGTETLVFVIDVLAVS